MKLTFEWDPRKAAHNLGKHGVAFSEAATVFADTLSATFGDRDHSTAENRYITIGMSSKGRLLIVSHTDRAIRIRIVSARQTTRSERKIYEEDA
jgi:uncharacterized DUF497 family protein